MTLKRVVVTGMGAITPLGNNLQDYWNNLIAGVSGADFIKGFNAEKFRNKICLRSKKL
jgi:3-oxoacyl-[acyl-carrier-protein] synthase II